jgi:membrane dipeptidase
MDRREFLVAGGAAGAALVLPAHKQAQMAAGRPSGASSIWVDALGGIGGLEEGPARHYAATPRLVEAVRQRRIDLVSMTVAEVGNGADRFRGAVVTMGFWNQTIDDNRALLMRIERNADIRAARAAGKVGVIYNFQDTTPLEGDSAHVATFAGLGVRVMQLTYNKRNLCGDGCLEPANAGLSDFGREVIGKINEAKVLLDLSHAGQRTTAEGIAASTAPPAITHSGCRALVDVPRNTHDAEMRGLADKGGVFGLYFMPFLRAKGQSQREDLLRHLEHAVNVCGEDHVGIGTDNPMFGIVINDESRKNQREFYEDRATRGIAAPGEAPDVFNMVEGYNGVSRFDRLAEDLVRRGWSSMRVDKVLGGNFVRLFGDVWPA